jgi:hypothetical protein
MKAGKGFDKSISSILRFGEVKLKQRKMILQSSSSYSTILLTCSRGSVSC